MSDTVSTPIEEWRPVQGYEGIYSISNHGRVRREPGPWRYGNLKTVRLLKLNICNKHGYATVSLCVNGVKKQPRVHKLVALAFLDNPDRKTQLNHKDGNKRNNFVDNIEWATPSENAIHAFQVLGRKMTRGEECSWSKFKNVDIVRIRKLYALGSTLTELAKEYNVWPAAIQRIVNRTRWGHVP